MMVKWLISEANHSAVAFMKVKINLLLPTSFLFPKWVPAVISLNNSCTSPAILFGKLLDDLALPNQDSSSQVMSV